ncbi:MAG: hypothetical protein LBN95_02220 [Prevotellaceae bacterium]|jgi:hypothetical protein|nr:hypothetical protein [Prevotellaceae bacterium]
MKKLLFTFVCLFGAMSLFAGNPVSVKSGDVSVLKDVTTALLELDFSNATVEGKTIDEYLESRGSDFVRDFPQDKEYSALMFAAQYNKKNKGLHVATDVSDAVLKFVIHVDKLDYGNAHGQFMPFASAKSGGCIISGTIDIIDLKTNEIVLTLSIDEVKGLANVSDKIRLGLCFFELGSSVAKVK